MDEQSRNKLSKEDKIVIAAMSAIASLDPKVLAMGLLASMAKSIPPEIMAGKSEEFIKVQCSMAAMGMLHVIMEDLQKAEKKRQEAKQATKEKPDSAFSDSDKAKAAEILAAFMARSGVHIKGES